MDYVYDCDRLREAATRDAIDALNGAMDGLAEAWVNNCYDTVAQQLDIIRRVASR